MQLNKISLADIENLINERAPIEVRVFEPDHNGGWKLVHKSDRADIVINLKENLKDIEIDVYERALMWNELKNKRWFKWMAKVNMSF